MLSLNIECLCYTLFIKYNEHWQFHTDYKEIGKNEGESYGKEVKNKYGVQKGDIFNYGYLNGCNYYQIIALRGETKIAVREVEQSCVAFDGYYECLAPMKNQWASADVHICEPQISTDSDRKLMIDVNESLLCTKLCAEGWRGNGNHEKSWPEYGIFVENSGRKASIRWKTRFALCFHSCCFLLWLDVEIMKPKMEWKALCRKLKNRQNNLRIRNK